MMKKSKTKTMTKLSKFNFIGILRFEEYPHMFGNDIIGVGYLDSNDHGGWYMGAITGDIKDILDNPLFRFIGNPDDLEDILEDLSNDAIYGLKAHPFKLHRCDYVHACRIALIHWNRSFDGDEPKFVIEGADEEHYLEFDMEPFLEKLRKGGERPATEE